MQIDGEFDDDRRGSSGRRASDAPTVPLRDHLETLIRGIEIRHEQEMSNLHAELKEFVQECREAWDKADAKLHKLKTEVAALRLLEEHRRGEQEGHKESRTGLQWILAWLPSTVAAAAAVYVAFFQ